MRMSVRVASAQLRFEPGTSCIQARNITTSVDLLGVILQRSCHIQCWNQLQVWFNV
jgi:hypothetical protein